MSSHNRPRIPAHLGELEIRAGGDKHSYLITLAGELDIATVDALHRALTRAEGSGCPEIVVDLTALSFIDSLGLRELLGLHRRCDASPQALRILPSPAAVVQRSLLISGLDQVLPLQTPTTTEAAHVKPRP